MLHPLFKTHCSSTFFIYINSHILDFLWFRSYLVIYIGYVCVFPLPFILLFFSFLFSSPVPLFSLSFLSLFFIFFPFFLFYLSSLFCLSFPFFSFLSFFFFFFSFFRSFLFFYSLPFLLLIRYISWWFHFFYIIALHIHVILKKIWTLIHWLNDIPPVSVYIISSLVLYFRKILNVYKLRITVLGASYF